jgi:hypothetical protein
MLFKVLLAIFDGHEKLRHFHTAALDSIRSDIGRACNHEFTGASHPSRPSEERLMSQFSDSLSYAPRDSLRSISCSI